MNYKNIIKNMGQIIFNNNTVNGDNINIQKNKIIVDGIDYTFEYENLNIQINGPIENLTISACHTIKATGNIDMINTQSGDVEVTGNVDGDIKTQSGDVTIDGLCGGNAKTMSGDIKSGSIGGNASSMSGDIKIR